MAFLAACTEAVPMHRRDAIDAREFYDSMRVRLNNGKTFETNRMTVTVSTVTIHELKRRWRSDALDEPIIIPMRDVDVIERIEFDESNSLATGVTFVLLSFVAWIITWTF